MKTDQTPHAPAASADAPDAQTHDDAGDRAPDTAGELGFLELLRAPGEGEAQPSATDRVLCRPRHSVWDY